MPRYDPRTGQRMLLQCGWCHRQQSAADIYCTHCGPELRSARMECVCPRCVPLTQRLQERVPEREKRC